MTEAKGIAGSPKHSYKKGDQPMSKNNGSPDFPREEEFVDFSGRTRKFTVELFDVPVGYGVCAAEDVKGKGGYVFRGFSTVDPFHALAHLRRRIRRLLSVRHLCKQGARLTLSHDRLRGRIAYGGVVVDGIFLTFKQLATLIQTYEGFQFDLKIVDSSDDLE